MLIAHVIYARIQEALEYFYARLSASILSSDLAQEKSWMWLVCMQIVLVERIPFHTALYFVTTTLTTGEACSGVRLKILRGREGAI